MMKICSRCKKHMMIDERIYCSFHEAFIDKDAEHIAGDCEEYE